MPDRHGLELAQRPAHLPAVLGRREVTAHRPPPRAPRPSVPPDRRVASRQRPAPPGVPCPPREERRPRPAPAHGPPGQGRPGPAGGPPVATRDALLAQVAHVSARHRAELAVAPKPPPRRARGPDLARWRRSSAPRPPPGAATSPEIGTASRPAAFLRHPRAVAFSPEPALAPPEPAARPWWPPSPSAPSPEVCRASRPADLVPRVRPPSPRAPAPEPPPGPGSSQRMTPSSNAWHAS
jgi:hypothetical protein